MSSAIVVENLELVSSQSAVLAAFGIDIDAQPIYVIKGEKFRRELAELNGYLTGHYIFFLNGTTEDHKE